MSTLDFFNPLDDVLKIGDKSFEIDMRIKNVLRFLELSEDDSIDNFSRLIKGIPLVLFGNDLSEYEPLIRVQAYNGLMKHIQGELPEPPKDIKGNPVPMRQQERTSDFRQDFDYIYASFIQTYNIDLMTERDMHYHKFRALLHALPPETIYRRVISIRTRKTDGLKGEELVDLMELKSIYALKGG